MRNSDTENSALSGYGSRKQWYTAIYLKTKCKTKLLEIFYFQLFYVHSLFNSLNRNIQNTSQNIQFAYEMRKAIVRAHILVPAHFPATHLHDQTQTFPVSTPIRQVALHLTRNNILAMLLESKSRKPRFDYTSSAQI